MDGDYPDFSQLKETFLAALGLGPCFIVLDGLDELADSSDMSLIEVFIYYTCIENVTLIHHNNYTVTSLLPR